MNVNAVLLDIHSRNGRKVGEVGVTEFIITCKSELKPDSSYQIERYRELIRCKDCQNSGLDSSGANGYWCSAHVEWHDADWFCADGKRKN